MVPADFDIDTWAQHNNAIAARVVDGVIVAVHPQVYNWHLTISSADNGYYDDDY